MPNPNSPPPGEESTVGERIEWARLWRGLKKKDIAEAVGVLPPRISAWLHPTRPERPSPEKMADLSIALGVSPGWLASGYGPVDAAEADAEADAADGSITGEIVRQIGRQADAQVQMQDRARRLEALTLRLARAVLEADILDRDSHRELLAAAMDLGRIETPAEVTARLEQELAEALRLAEGQTDAGGEGNRGQAR